MLRAGCSHIEIFIDTRGPVLIGRITNRLVARKFNRGTFFSGELTVKRCYLVAANVTKNLLVNKQAAQKFDVERFSLNKLR